MAEDHASASTSANGDGQQTPTPSLLEQGQRLVDSLLLGSGATREIAPPEVVTQVFAELVATMSAATEPICAQVRGHIVYRLTGHTAVAVLDLVFDVLQTLGATPDDLKRIIRTKLETARAQMANAPTYQHYELVDSWRRALLSLDAASDFTDEDRRFPPFVEPEKAETTEEVAEQAASAS